MSPRNGGRVATFSLTGRNSTSSGGPGGGAGASSAGAVAGQTPRTISRARPSVTADRLIGHLLCRFRSLTLAPHLGRGQERHPFHDSTRCAALFRANVAQ